MEGVLRPIRFTLNGEPVTSNNWFPAKDFWIHCDSFEEFVFIHGIPPYVTIHIYQIQ